VQLSGSQWGTEGDPDAQGTLQKAVTAVNSLAQQPDVIVQLGFVFGACRQSVLCGTPHAGHPAPADALLLMSPFSAQKGTVCAPPGLRGQRCDRPVANPGFRTPNLGRR
jgi:hypothetical protein